MKKLIFICLLLLLPLYAIRYTLNPAPVYAACPPIRSDLALVPLPASDSASVAILKGSNEDSGKWECDPEVTFTGKLAARSKEVLDWLLENYAWAKITPIISNQPTPFDVPFQFIRGVVYAILGLFILAAAFLMIITRGRSITVRRFIVRFLFVAVFVWFSFSIVSTIYFLTDIIQNFFIQITPEGEPTRNIRTQDLLNISFDYKDFQGYRRIGDEYNESAITSLLLAKLTAATYYTMFVILIIRKIILWFFILVSPIFPLLLFFKPIRNTAKIWVGEFFRWVLYAPLFMIFLRGLVEIWRFGSKDNTGIPLFFDLSKAGDLNSIIYPTSINITLGGPITKLPLSGAQNVNYVDTFVLYLVALIMLWMVIIMPWILLKIFLDYFYNNTSGEENLLKFIAKNGGPLSPLVNRWRGPNGPVSPAGTPPEGPPPGSASLAKSLPMTRFKHTPVAEIQESLAQSQAQAQAQAQATESARAQSAIGAVSQTAQSVMNQAADAQRSSLSSMGQLIANQNLKVPDLQTQQITADLLSATNLSIPTMTDIAKYETAMLSKSSSGKEEVNRMNEMLGRLSGSSPIASPAEKQQSIQIRDRLVKESTKGNPVAKSMTAAIAPGGGANIPDENRVQQVNLDDYEEVKRTWHENYKSLEPPAGPDGKPLDRVAWLKTEVAQIPKVIDLLLSGDPAQQEKGKQMVSKILPFLLLGGFSKAEIVAYLKAKLEAAKQALNEALQVEKENQDEESKVEVKREEGHAQAVMHAEAELPEEKDKSN